MLIRYFLSRLVLVPSAAVSVPSQGALRCVAWSSVVWSAGRCVALVHLRGNLGLLGSSNEVPEEGRKEVAASGGKVVPELRFHRVRKRGGGT